MNIADLPQIDRRAHAVVIGSGFGGLAAAIRLGARGYRVTVLEKLDQAGGRAYTWHDDGFVFDAGPTIITAPFLFEELWALCGRRLSDDVELREVSPFYQIRFADGQTMDCSADAREMREQVRKISPADVEGYERFMAHSEKIFKLGFEALAHLPFGSVGSMVRVAPDLLRLGAYRSVHGLVSRYVRHDKLRTALSFHPLLIGGNPFDTTSIYALISFLERQWGVHCAIGGTGRLVAGMVDLIHGQGGRVLLNQGVQQIITDQGVARGVRLQDGSELAAQVVVSNADAASTYRHLLADTVRRRWTDSKVDSLQYSMSLFVWYFGTDRQFAQVPHHSILLGPRYKALLEDIFDRKTLADDFSLYLHRPTATDASLAPAGCDSFYVLAPVPHLDARIDWSEQAQPYRQRIETFLAATVLPGLAGHVVRSRMLTPQDFHDRLGSLKGAAFGPAPVFSQSAWFRPHNASEDVRNLFLVGAGTHPGAGVPGVLSSARVLDSVVPSPEVFA